MSRGSGEWTGSLYHERPDCRCGVGVVGESGVVLLDGPGYDDASGES